MKIFWQGSSWVMCQFDLHINPVFKWVELTNLGGSCFHVFLVSPRCAPKDIMNIVCLITSSNTFCWCFNFDTRPTWCVFCFSESMWSAFAGSSSKGKSSVASGSEGRQGDSNASATVVEADTNDGNRPSPVVANGKPETSTVKSSSALEMASSQSGEVKMILTYGSVLGRSDFQMPTLDAVVKLMDDKCQKEYKEVDPNFSVMKVMTDICQCFLEMSGESTNKSSDEWTKYVLWEAWRGKERDELTLQNLHWANNILC